MAVAWWWFVMWLGWPLYKHGWCHSLYGKAHVKYIDACVRRGVRLSKRGDFDAR